MFSDLARHDTVRAVQEVEYQVIREICVTQRLDSESLFARSDKMADIIDNTTADIHLLQCCGLDYTAQNELTAVLLYMMVHVVQVDSWRLAGEGRSPQPR